MSSHTPGEGTPWQTRSQVTRFSGRLPRYRYSPSTWQGVPEKSTRPVSYTHLDVYKRQVEAPWQEAKERILAAVAQVAGDYAG